MLAPLETALNHVLAHDLFARATLAALQGQVLAVQIRDTGFTVYLTPCREGLLHLSTIQPAPPRARIEARPFSLFQLLRQPPVTLAGQSDVRIDGDIQFAQTLSNLLKNLHLDWEETLARLVGDLPAHWLGRSIRAGWTWSLETWLTAQHNVADYAQEELRILPAYLEVQDFLDEVDQVRAATERLAQRIQRLERQA